MYEGADKYMDSLVGKIEELQQQLQAAEARAAELEAREAQYRAALEESKYLYQVNTDINCAGSYQAAKSADDRAKKIFNMIDKALSTPPGPVAALIEAVGKAIIVKDGGISISTVGVMKLYDAYTKLTSPTYKNEWGEGY
jgi:hypothetical protein